MQDATSQLAHGLSTEIVVPQPMSLEEMRGDDRRFLRGSARKFAIDQSNRNAIPIIDLFSGVGGLSLGVHEAAWHRRIGVETALAIESDPYALKCYQDNLGGHKLLDCDIRDVFDHRFDARLSKEERRILGSDVTDGILIGGPPCQGHSDLNNSTRRNDPKNSLYFLMARAAKILEPRAVVIENVPTVVHDRKGVVGSTRDALASMGYHVFEHVFEFIRFGVPQLRRRHLIIATRSDISGKLAALAASSTKRRDLRWAISDLEGLEDRSSLRDQVSRPNAVTRKRIDHLFDNGLVDLPDSERPECHRLKNHSYKSIYGRLSWDEPAQTVTRGFYCMCMGRYVHPSERRTLTAHEAARIQFFPDWFRFDSAGSRTRLATMIGNAVPSKLGFVVGLVLLDELFDRKEHSLD